jgi:hypothetical protein
MMAQYLVKSRKVRAVEDLAELAPSAVEEIAQVLKLSEHVASKFVGACEQLRQESFAEIIACVAAPTSPTTAEVFLYVQFSYESRCG